MACFPKIDQPCPLGIDEQKRIDGYCGRCSKAVHSLDAMNDAERVGFMRNASGPVCVTYRVNVRRGTAIGLGAALALSMAAPSHADPVQATDANSAQVMQTPAVSPDSQKLEEITLTGGVSDPASAQFVDEDDVPDMPIVRE